MRLNGSSNHAKKLNSSNFEPQDWEIGKTPLPISVGNALGPEVHVETNETDFWNSARVMRRRAPGAPPFRFEITLNIARMNWRVFTFLHFYAD